jgi:hypothetical protein
MLGEGLYQNFVIVLALALLLNDMAVLHQFVEFLVQP